MRPFIFELLSIYKQSRRLITNSCMAIILFSCSGPSEKNVQEKTIDENWQIKDVITQRHFYNMSGLLDTSYKSETIYVNGEKSMTMNFFVTRNYDMRNNLTDEKTYLLLEKNKELSEEKIFEYDTNNNLILETDKVENVIDKILKIQYNGINQKIVEITIQQKFEATPKNWNLDSAMAHSKEKKTQLYDTSQIFYEYGSRGEFVKEIRKNSKQEIIETLITFFKDRKKTLTLGIGTKGDTISICNYEKQENLVAEIKRSKKTPSLMDTVLYDGIRKIKSVYIDNKANYKHKETYKYDDKGNEIENISYK